MQDEAWIKTLDDGREVKFSYLELSDDGGFITAQLAGNEVVCSVGVESHSRGEHSKK